MLCSSSSHYYRLFILQILAELFLPQGSHLELLNQCILHHVLLLWRTVTILDDYLIIVSFLHSTRVKFQEVKDHFCFVHYYIPSLKFSIST